MRNLMILLAMLASAPAMAQGISVGSDGSVGFVIPSAPSAPRAQGGHSAGSDPLGGGGPFNNGSSPSYVAVPVSTGQSLRHIAGKDCYDSHGNHAWPLNGHDFIGYDTDGNAVVCK